MLHQRDTYFNVPHGRLKLREEGERAWLIPYDRSDAGEARLSRYRLVGPLARECRLARLKDGRAPQGGPMLPCPDFAQRSCAGGRRQPPARKEGP